MGWPIKRVDRGGYITSHGPGQLVRYLVVDVKARGPVDLVRWAGKRRGVTSHGFALNVDPDMTAFRRFVACGLADVTG